MVFSLTVEDGLVRVDCEANRDDAPNQFSQMHMRALDIARTSVNLIAFTNGAGVSVVLDTITNPQGVETAILMRAVDVGKLCTAFGPNTERFRKILGMIYQDLPWFLGLNDLIESISVPHFTPRNCARAVEALRSLIGKEEDERGDQWVAMREQLNLSKEYLKKITDHSRESRHGAPSMFHTR